MVKNELKLYLKSKFNILIIVFTIIPIALSYYTTFKEKLMWEQQLLNPAEDMNVGMTREIVEEYSGFRYIFDFLYSTDYSIIWFLIMAMGFSCLFGGRVFGDLKKGFGNMAVIRMGYPKYIKNILTAQCIYVAGFTAAFYVLLTVFTAVVFPFKPNGIRFYAEKLSAADCVKIYLLQIFLVVILMILMTVITSLSNVVLNNKYIIHCVPLLLYFIPFVLASTIGNMSDIAARITSLFVLDNRLLAMESYFSSDASQFEKYLDFLVLPIFLVLLSVAGYIFNKKRFQERYQ